MGYIKESKGVTFTVIPNTLNEVKEKMILEAIAKDKAEKSKSKKYSRIKQETAFVNDPQEVLKTIDENLLALRQVDYEEMTEAERQELEAELEELRALVMAIKKKVAA